MEIVCVGHMVAYESDVGDWRSDVGGSEGERDRRGGEGGRRERETGDVNVNLDKSI